MIHVHYTCDVCGTPKEGEGDHWLSLRRSERATIYPTLEIRSFEDAGSEGPHFCSAGCMAVKIDEFTTELLRKVLDSQA